jgi:hypothetical protein
LRGIQLYKRFVFAFGALSCPAAINAAMGLGYCVLRGK